MCKNILERNIYVRSKFILCARLTTCVRARAQLRGNIDNYTL